MDTLVERIDPFNGPLNERISLLIREGIRRGRDRTLRTRALELIDTLFGLGYWWFQTFEYECRNPDGSLWKQQRVRQTLAGYIIAWGHYTEFYDDGQKAMQGINRCSASFGRSTYRNYEYWLPNGTQVSQAEWMFFTFGPEIDGCYDPAWEK